MKHRIFILLGFLITFNNLQGQNGYTERIQEALQKMWKSNDTTGYKQSLDMFEEAFAAYPDSIDGLGLYKASVLASELHYNYKAFKYLGELLKLKKDNYGSPCWTYIVGKYSENEYKNLLSDLRWQYLVMQAEKEKAVFYQELSIDEKEFYQTKNTFLTENRNGNLKELYEEIKRFNPYLPKNKQDYSIVFTINDSTKTSFLVHLPPNYNPEKKYPLLFFLHGAVRNNALTDFQMPEWNLKDWNRFYTKYAEKDGVVLVFPKADREYNWMIPDKGFFIVPEILKLIKRAINIDDAKVFITGHSNGATGSFSYMMKQPSFFAAAYGFNTYPKVFTGGTFIENLTNRSFISFTTDQDYYYPPQANDDFTKLMQGVGLNYKEYRYNGYPHWFPEFDKSEEAVKILFEDIKQKRRPKFPSNILWEFDDNKYGNIDWLSNICLDTLSAPQKWHTIPANFKIDKWLKYNKEDSLETIIVDRQAFDFPRKSGKIKANYHKNIFHIETSCIQSFCINLSPEMVDMNKKIKVYVNGKLHFNKKVLYNKSFLLENFDENQDRERIWVNQIKISVDKQL